MLELSEATAADQQRLIEALRQQARGHLMAGRRRALIVANDVNEHEGLERLPAPAADAEALAAVLGDAAIGGFEVDVVHNEPAHVIQGRIEDLFAESRIDDVLLQHFSCHGLKAVRATPARRRWVYVAAGVALLALAAAVVAYVLASFSGPRVVALRQDTEFQASA